MVFSSATFLFLFLPIVLGLYYFAAPRYRSGLLVVASLGYYGWGEARYLWIVCGSVALNYVFGLLVDSFRQGWRRRLVMTAAVVINIGLLGYYKYTNFFVDNLNTALPWLLRGTRLDVTRVALPLGISFFTFHALSYVIDIYRKQAAAQRNPLLLTLYILFFPQLVAGPIVRYHEIADQLTDRRTTLAEAAIGVQRFIVGLAKKLLVANFAGEVADAIYGLPPGELTARSAWLAAYAYALQIYFDFSGYSDMAIGLAHLFGFRFPENFNYPYVADSITDFWRRWHMSLSRWFRDYLYIPLGGNRAGTFRLYVNLVTVFFLCGLWHGASWNFVLWGMLHGALLVVERMGGLRLLDRVGPVVRRLYVLPTLLVTWVFFRAETLAGALAMLKAMVGRGAGSIAAHPLSSFLDERRAAALALGAVACLPVVRWTVSAATAGRPRARALIELARVAALGLLLLSCAMRLSSGTYNPFIYFRF